MNLQFGHGSWEQHLSLCSMWVQLGHLTRVKDPLSEWPTHMADRELTWDSCSTSYVGLLGFPHSVGTGSRSCQSNGIKSRLSISLPLPSLMISSSHTPILSLFSRDPGLLAALQTCCPGYILAFELALPQAYSHWCPPCLLLIM